MRHGFLFIDKPVGPTSHDIVGMVRKTLSERKVGHLGTLDPLANGLLVLGVGAKALKVFDLFSQLTKEYVVDIRLGSESTTYDREGVITAITPKPGWKPPDDASRIQAIIADRFVGSISQVPPAFSAINIAGQRAHRLARSGKDVAISTREVRISSCTVESYAYPNLRLHIACSAGTYIRSLAHDLGRTLRCGGYVAALRRTKVGEWRLADACTPESLSWAQVVPLKNILFPFHKADLSDGQWDDISHGRSISMDVLMPVIAWHAQLPVAILEADTKRPGYVKPRKVL